MTTKPTAYIWDTTGNARLDQPDGSPFPGGSPMCRDSRECYDFLRELLHVVDLGDIHVVDNAGNLVEEGCDDDMVEDTPDFEKDVEATEPPNKPDWAFSLPVFISREGRHFVAVNMNKDGGETLIEDFDALGKFLATLVEGMIEEGQDVVSIT